jgi:type I restriction enzyme S subunit
MSDISELWELPEGWAWAEFQQVARVASNLVNPAAFPASPHIAPNHIESGSGKLLSYTTVAEDRVKSA